MTCRLGIALAVLATTALGGCAALRPGMSHVNAAFDHISEQEWPEAEDDLAAALEEDKRNPWAVLNMGVVYQETDRPEQARVMYKEVLEIDPGDRIQRTNVDEMKGRKLVTVARENLARLESNQAFELIRAERYDEARRHLDLALERDPDNPLALLNLGWVHQKQGNTEKAREHYHRVLDHEREIEVDFVLSENFAGKTVKEMARTNLEALDGEAAKGGGGA